MSNSSQKRQRADVTENTEVIISTGKDDMNVVEVPFTLLGKKNSVDQKIIETRYLKKGKNDQIRECFWEVEGGAKVGLPTFLEEEVFIGLMELTSRQGFQGPRVHTSRCELLDIMTWAENGYYLKRLELALNRLRATSIRTNDFWDNENKCYTIINFGIIDGYQFFENERRGRNSRQRVIPLGYVDWNRILFEKSFKKGYIKTLNTDIYFSLATPVSKRLYRYEDKYFYRGEPFERDLFYLVHEKLGISRKLAYPSLIKKALYSAIREHGERGLADIKIRKSKTTPSGYKIVFTPIKPVQIFVGASEPDAIQESAEDTDRNSLVGQLADRGVSKVIAAELVQKYPSSRIESKIEAFDWLVQTNSPRARDNPPGFLRKSIEEDWQPPPGFISNADREKQTKQAQEQKKQREAKEKETFDQARMKYAERRVESRWKDLWDQMAYELRDKLSPEALSSWIEPTLIADVQENVVVLNVPNRFFGRWIEEHYAGDIEEVLSTMRGQPTKLQVVCDGVGG